MVQTIPELIASQACFEIETCFLVCNPIFSSTLGVQKKLGENFFFPRNHRGAWNKLYQSPRGIGLTSFGNKICNGEI